MFSGVGGGCLEDAFCKDYKRVSKSCGGQLSGFTVDDMKIWATLYAWTEPYESFVKGMALVSY